MAQDFIHWEEEPGHQAQGQIHQGEKPILQEQEPIPQEEGVLKVSLVLSKNKNTLVRNAERVVPRA